MEHIDQQFLTGERALFRGKDLLITNTVFDDGESPLKHSENIVADGCLFRWKYPFWYSKNIEIKNSVLFEMARAGIWYTDNVVVRDTMIEAPKEFRKCNGVTLENVSIPNAAETFWNCNNVTLNKVTAKGDYFAMGCSNVKLKDFELYGNYSFDGATNVEAENCKFLSKDCFWNADNIVIRNSFISGEYFGWNSKNITLIDCTVESLQGMCFIENLVMKNCKIINTTLAFEYSTVDIESTTRIDSVKNPISGVIKAPSIGELILEADLIDPSKTSIKVEG